MSGMIRTQSTSFWSVWGESRTRLCVKPAYEGDENPRFYEAFIDTIHLKQTTSFVVPIDISMN